MPKYTFERTVHQKQMHVVHETVQVEAEDIKSAQHKVEEDREGHVRESFHEDGEWISEREVTSVEPRNPDRS